MLWITYLPTGRLRFDRNDKCGFIMCDDLWVFREVLVQRKSLFERLYGLRFLVFNNTVKAIL